MPKFQPVNEEFIEKDKDRDYSYLSASIGFNLDAL
jgi:hypothetical protein